MYDELAKKYVWDNWDMLKTDDRQLYDVINEFDVDDDEKMIDWLFYWFEQRANYEQ